MVANSGTDHAFLAVVCFAVITIVAMIVTLVNSVREDRRTLAQVELRKKVLGFLTAGGGEGFAYLFAELAINDHKQVGGDDVPSSMAGLFNALADWELRTAAWITSNGMPGAHECFRLVNEMDQHLAPIAKGYEELGKTAISAVFALISSEFERQTALMRQTAPA